MLLQVVALEQIFMDWLDSSQAPTFQITTLNTVDVQGISQFPAGTSLNLASSTFSWSQVAIVPAIILLQGHVLRSQTLLQMIIMIHSCFAVSLYLTQCTQWGIPLESYSRL